MNPNQTKYFSLSPLSQTFLLYSITTKAKKEEEERKKYKHNGGGDDPIRLNECGCGDVVLGSGGGKHNYLYILIEMNEKFMFFLRACLRKMIR